LKEIASWYPLWFYRRKDNQISKFSDKNKVFLNVIKSSEFSIIRDNLLFYGRKYTWDLYIDLLNILKVIPIEWMKQFEWSINSEYSDIAMWKNIYLTSVWLFSENIAYSLNVKNWCFNIFNSVMVWNNSQNVYFSNSVIKSLNIFYSKVIYDSNNIWFSFNLIWCSECILCTDLKNKSYCINNIEYSKEIYYKKKSEILKPVFYEKFISDLNSRINLSPEILNFRSEWIINWFMNYDVKNSRNSVFAWWWSITESVFDVVSVWMEKTSDFYWVMWWWFDSENIYCSVEIVKSTNIYYSYLLENCFFCLWCIWLKNKSFCILNKQYTKEEWYDMVDKIFSQMEKDGTLWEFFPWSLNPFYFNDTKAYLIGNSYFTKEKVEKEWYMWREEVIKVDIPEWAEVVYVNNINDVRNEKFRSLEDYQGFDSNWNWFINPEILKKVIQDESWNVYRIVQMEYDFLVKYWLPLPENHWLDRIKSCFWIS
jgi:hypothetical protein